MAWIEALYDILEIPTKEACTEIILLFCFVWLGFVVGVMVGWAWKPNWASLLYSSAKTLYLSSPTKSNMSLLNEFDSAQCSGSIKLPLEGCEALEPSPSEYGDCSTSQITEETPAILSLVTEKDLELLCQLVEMKDGGSPWIEMMDCPTENMTYQAWRRDPKTGPPQYRTRTVFEDATPEMVRDFFWDDEFRLKWDDRLEDALSLEECPMTGTMVVRWIRKFPIFCSNREYIIGRRIWQSGNTYYCVTKGVPCPSVARCNKLRRVDVYYSSWYIREVESIRGCSQLTACEVLLFHHEDMGISREITKIGVRQGMWGAVEKIEFAFRAYQKERASGAPLSHSALLAQINTKIDPDYLRCLGNGDNSLETQVVASSTRPLDNSIPKVLLLGGAIILACCIDRMLLNKAFKLGVARKFANLGK